MRRVCRACVRTSIRQFLLRRQLRVAIRTGGCLLVATNCVALQAGRKYLRSLLTYHRRADPKGRIAELEKRYVLLRSGFRITSIGPQTPRYMTNAAIQVMAAAASIDM